MAAQRIKGQEVEFISIVNGTPQTSLTAVKSLDFAFKTEILEEGYLGETSKRFDTIFNGIRGKVQFHYDSPDVFLLVNSIVDKARRRIPGTIINCKVTLNFPSGIRSRVMISNVEFGELPFGFGARQDYGTFSIEYAAPEARVL